MKKLLQSIFIVSLVVSLPNGIFAMKYRGGYRKRTDKIENLVRLGYMKTFEGDLWSCSLCEKERGVRGRRKRKQEKTRSRDVFRHMRECHGIDLYKVLRKGFSDAQVRKIFDDALGLGIPASFDISQRKNILDESAEKIVLPSVSLILPVGRPLECFQAQELPPIRNVLADSPGQEKLPSFSEIFITGQKRLREEGSSEGNPLERIAIANLLNPLEFEPEAKRRKFD